MNSTLSKKTSFVALGTMGYEAAWDYQTDLFQKTVMIKTANRTRAVEDQEPTPNYLLFCEHPHVYTLGKSGKEENLLIKKEDLHTIQASYVQSNRGGDITYHGPGQLVGYPILDLENFFTDIHRYMRLMEEAVILTLREFDIHAGRINGLTGVWLDADDMKKARKICALGVKTSRWVTMHGFAFNINTDLNYFNHIIPCGITDKAVTSMQRELGTHVDQAHVATIVKNKIVELFEMELI